MSSESHSVSDLKGTSSTRNFFDYSSFFLLSASVSYLVPHIFDQIEQSWIGVCYKVIFDIDGGSSVEIVGDSVYALVF